jgi:hypothetical protein
MTALLIDATVPVLPARFVAAERIHGKIQGWEELGFPPKPRMPWYGYSLGADRRTVEAERPSEGSIS